MEEKEQNKNQSMTGCLVVLGALVVVVIAVTIVQQTFRLWWIACLVGAVLFTIAYMTNFHNLKSRLSVVETRISFVLCVFLVIGSFTWMGLVVTKIDVQSRLDASKPAIQEKVKSSLMEQANTEAKQNKEEETSSAPEQSSATVQLEAVGTMLDPGTFPSGSSEQVVAQFLGYWKTRDWNGMFQVSQLTWRQSNDATMLSTLFGDKSIVGAQIIGKTESDDLGGVSAPGAVVDYVVRITYQSINGSKTEDFEVRVICETAAYAPSASGSWGVNPFSVE